MKNNFIIDCTDYVVMKGYYVVMKGIIDNTFINYYVEYSRVSEK